MILHVVESFGSGVYEFIKELVWGLPQYRHIIIHGKRKETPLNFKEEFPKNTVFFPWKSANSSINPIQDIKALIELYKLVKPYKNEILALHLHSSKAGFAGRVIAKFLGLEEKVIYTPHGVSFLRLDVHPAKRKFFIFLEKFAYSLGGKVVACSESEAQELKKVGIEASYIRTGIKCRSGFKISNKNKTKFTIITVGRITHQKNPKLFNQIAEQFLDQRDVKFIWVGEGDLKHELKSPNISITGWLSREDVMKLLLEADLYISTSLWEGLPLSILQAMCSMKPLLLTPCVGNRDMVDEGYNGFFFRTVEEGVKYIKLLKQDTNLLDFMGKNAYKLLKNKFPYEEMLNGYAKLYSGKF